LAIEHAARVVREDAAILLGTVRGADPVIDARMVINVLPPRSKIEPQQFHGCTGFGDVDGDVIAYERPTDVERCMTQPAVAAHSRVQPPYLEVGGIAVLYPYKIDGSVGTDVQFGDDICEL